MRLSEKIKIIEKSPLFTNLNNKEVKAIAEIANLIKLSKGDLLISQGDKESGAYVIAQGLVKIYKITTDGNVINLAMAGPGEIVGEMSLFNQVIRTATVEAVRETLALDINDRNFKKLLEVNPHITTGILKVVTQRLIESHHKLKDAYFENLYHRVWESLKILAKHFPGEEITLSHNELAEIVGATRPRVTEILNKLQDENKIELLRGKIIFKKK